MTSKTDKAGRLNPTVAGLLFFLAGSIILMGIITGEVFYPKEYHYSTADSMISDLGATEPPNSVITQPSALIFNTTMIVTGIMILIGTFFFYRTKSSRLTTALLLIVGLGVLGVGIFPGNVNPQHPISAMMAFIGGGLAAISSFRPIKSPFRYVAALLGLTTLVFLFGAGFFVPALGWGGTERWVAYPVILWLVGFGGYLMGTGTKKDAI